MPHYGIWCAEMTKKANYAAAYHLDTSYRRNKISGHVMDWQNQPNPIKPYENPACIPLEKQVKLPDHLFHEIISGRAVIRSDKAKMDLTALSALMALSYTFTAQTRQMGKPFFYRNAASAGALYPCEIYVGSHMDGPLERGIYHYNIFDFLLETIRQEDVGQWVAEDKTGKEGPIPVISLFITSVFFRSSWKYRSRAYRYVLLDTGHLMANMMWALTSMGIDGHATLDFDDNAMGLLLGLDPEKEVCLGLINLCDDHRKTGSKTDRPGSKPSYLGADIIKASTVSKKEVRYQQILSMHNAGNDIRPFNPDNSRSVDIPVKTWFHVNPEQKLKTEKYTDVLWKRRSKRNYVPIAFSKPSFMALLSLLCDQFTGKMEKKFSDTITVGMLINNVHGISPGFYCLDPQKRKYGLVFKARLGNQMAAACLDQMWLGNAAVHFLFLADLEAVAHQYGPRGYRYAMIQAGRLGQIIYLGATAVGAGACGIGAIYDFEAENLLDLDDETKLLYLVAAGPVKR